MQEDAVQHRARRGLQAEADVREPKQDLALRERLGDAADALERLEAKAPVLVVAGGDGEGERVEEEVVLVQAPLAREEVVDARGDLDLAVGGLRHAGLHVLVDGQRHACRAVALQQRADLVEALLAVLEVDAVHDAAAARALERGLDHVGLRAVHHERRVDVLHVAARHLGHVLDAVTAHEVDAHVEQVAAVAHLLLGHAHQAVPVAGIEEALELLAAVGVGALGHDQEAVVLAELGEPVQARAAGRAHRGARHGRARSHHLAQRADVVGGGAAAAAHDAGAVILEVPPHGCAEGIRAQRILGAAVHQDGEARVRNHAERAIPVLGEVGDVLGHLRGAGGAVEAEARDRERTQRVHHGRDVGAEQHGARGLHGDARQDRNLLVRLPCRADGVEARVHRALHLQEVLRRLHDQAVRAAVDQAARLLAVGVEHGFPRGLPQRDELGAGADGARHEARTVTRAELVRGGACAPRCADVELVDPLHHLLVELGGHQLVGTERVGLHHVRTRGEEALVDPLDQVRPALHQDVGAVLAAEVILGAAIRAGVDAGAHRAVKNHDATIQR